MEKYDIIIEKGATICYNRKASSLSPIKMGGAISVLILPNSVEGLVVALDNTTNPIVLGNMSNVLVSDKGYSGEIISTKNIKGYSVEGNIVKITAGEHLSTLVDITKKNSLEGAEGLVGIPGSIGGAIAMNAGAFGYTISDYLDSVKVYDNGNIYSMSKEECKFSYRNSIFSFTNIVVLEATFCFPYQNKLIITKKIKDIKQKRLNTQPTQSSLGSVFKRHNDTSSGYYIDMVGLKGYKIGGAMISNKHANFIVNVENGTSTDFYNLACIANEKVREKYGFSLDMEVKLIGEFERKI